MTGRPAPATSRRCPYTAGRRSAIRVILGAMGELRGNEQPDRPVETRDQIDADRIKELNSLGDAKVFDPRTPAYNPAEHVGPRRQQPEQTHGLGDRPTLLGLSAKIREARESRYEQSDAEEPAEAVDDQPDKPRPWRTIADEEGEVRAFHSYSAAKRGLGSVQGHEIHHIVEQSQTNPNRSGFDVERVNTTDNLTRIPEDKHRAISAQYSSKAFGADETMRNSLNGEPWNEQYDHGSRMLDMVFGKDEDDDDSDD